MNNYRKRSFKWKFYENIFSQFSAIGLSIYLARNLLPIDFGIFSLSLVFIEILNVLLTTGFNTSLIRGEQKDFLSYNTIIIFNFGISIVFYIIIFILSNPVSIMLGTPLLSVSLKLLGILIIINPIKVILISYFEKNLLLKNLFFSHSISIFFTIIITVITVTNDYGIYALIYNSLSSNLFFVFFLLIQLKNQFSFNFSFKLLRIHLKFSIKLIISGTINSIYQQIYNFIVGILFSLNDLGLFSKAQQIPRLLFSPILDGYGSVSLVEVVNYKNDIKKLKFTTRNIIRSMGFIIFPIVFGLISIRDLMITIIFGNAWLDTSNYMAIFALSYIFLPMQILIQNSLNSIGRTDIFLKMDIISKFILTLLITIGIFYGIYGLSFSILLISLINFFIKVHYSNKYLNYKFIEHINDHIRSFFSSILMYSSLIAINFGLTSDFFTLILKVFLGIILYILFSLLFNYKQLRKFFSNFKSSFLSIKS
jgi:O-antigen/teichoic acid export membrane protein